MVKWLLVILLVVGAIKLFRKPEAIKAKEEVNAVDTVQDPVTGTFVSKDTEYKVKYYDKVYYFSSKESMDKFIAEKRG
ncbi:MAG: YHS domain-containing protein [Deferribacterales bacterium]